ncbi:hypothetical protein M2448_004210, partial [Dysgonomonas sp. PF1-14]
MNRIFHLLLLSIIAVLPTLAQLKTKVDERFELTSIAFRLAGAEEYTNNEVSGYISDIDNYFSKYKNHALIGYIKKIRERDEIAYNAISGSTNLLEIKKGKVQIKQGVNIANYIKDDDRWSEVTLIEYFRLLNIFYKDTKFQHFFNTHTDFYKQTEARLDDVVSKINISWFESFFGEPLKDPAIYASLCNGRNNYALPSSGHIDNHIEKFGIVIGCNQIDEAGIPVFDAISLTPIIIHEFCHHFTNPLVDKYDNELISSAEKIFPYVKDQLYRVAYNTPNSIYREGFNNLFVNMYYRENPTTTDKHEIAKNERHGFIWMERAICFMDNFYYNRKVYPYIDDFMSQLTGFLEFVSKNIETIVNEYKNKNPYVVNIFPILDSKVDSSLKEITIYFSHPMWNSFAIFPTEEEELKIP